MQRAKSVFPIFLLFLIVSIVIFFFLQSPLTQSLQLVTLPLQKWSYTTFSPTPGEQTVQDKLQDENTNLKLQLAKMKEFENDNKALRDQFAKTSPAPKNLVPAAVVGLSDTTMMIDKGEADSIKIGEVAIVKNNLIGSISKVSPHLSVVTLISNPITSFTAKTTKTNTIGVVRAQGSDSIYLDNVVLSDKLETDDMVVTKGDINADGQGYPPDLIVGTIASVNKVDSNLFQQAKIRTLLNLSKIRMVFIIKN
jgi:rod shape-determining protein MreC